MNLRTLTAIAVPAAAFAVTIALMYEPGHEPAGVGAGADRTRSATTPAAPAAPAARQAVAAAAPAFARSAAPGGTATDDPPAHVTAAGVLPDQATPAGGTQGANPPLPVRFYAVEGPSGGMQSSIISMSTEELDVRVTDVNTRTRMRSSADVSLRPRQRINLATEGLQMTTGDQVTIESPGFAPLEVTVQ